MGWRQAWLFLALTLMILVANLAVIARWNPGLLPERLKPDRPAKPFDRVIVALMTPTGLAVFVVAGLEVLRYNW